MYARLRQSNDNNDTKQMNTNSGLGTQNFYFQDRKNWKFQIFQDIRVTKNAFFVVSGAHNFGTFRAEAKITIRRHEVVYRLSSEHKMIDLE